MCCISCFLNWRLRCHSQDLGLIFHCRRLRRGLHFLRTGIATHQPSLSSPNLRSLGHIVYPLSSANASIVVVNSMGQAVKDYLPLGFWLCISSCDGLHLWLLGAVVYLILLETAPLKTVEVQTEYLGYFTRNIKSFGSSFICLVDDIDKTRKRCFNLSRQWKTTYFWVVDFFILVTVCSCDCW